MKPKTKIIIAEDHKLVREAFVGLLSTKEEIEIIDTASNGKELLQILSQKVADIVLLDLSMPVLSGGQALDRYRVTHPNIKTIILSNYYRDCYIVEYFMKGVSGYLSKNCDIEELLTAIRQVMKNDYYFDSGISKSLVMNMINDKKRGGIDKLELTTTELEILVMICEEKNNKQIGEIMKLSPHTIDYYRRNILFKTQQSTVIGLVKYAIKKGIIDVL